MAVSIEYVETLAALENLQALFTCELCSTNSSENLFSLASCTHVFCKNCADKYMSKSCPICHIFAKAKDMRPNTQLNTLANRANEVLNLIKDQNLNSRSLPEDEQSSLVVFTDETRRLVEDYAKSVENCYKSANSSKLCTPSPKRVMYKKSVPISKNKNEYELNDSFIHVYIGTPPSSSSLDLNGNKSDPVTLNEKQTEVLTVDSDNGSGDSGKKRNRKRPMSNGKTKKSKTATAERRKTLNILHQQTVDAFPGEKRTSTESELNVSFTRLIDDQRDKKGNSRLQKVCMYKKENITLVKRLLVDENANPNVMDNNRWTPLHEACSRGHFRTVEMLLKNGAIVDVGGGDDLITPLQDAILHEHSKVVEILLFNGADMNRRTLRGRTPMDLALLKKNDVILKLLNDCKLKQNQFSEFAPKIEPRLPVSNTSKTVLCYSGLSEQEQNCVTRLSSVLKINVEKSVSCNFTHLIVPSSLGGRTVKFFSALSMGKWVVSMDWVIKSLENSSLVPEEPYEATGSKEFPQSGAPKLARVSRMMLQPPLLTGGYFFCRDFNTPILEDFKKVIEVAGAKITKREPRGNADLLEEHTTFLYHADPSLDVGKINYFIVYDNNDPSALEKPVVNTDRIRTVPLRWALDCLEQYKILEV